MFSTNQLSRGSAEEIERIDNFTTEIKEAFSTQFDPELEVKESIIITQDNQRRKTANKKIIPLNNSMNSQPVSPLNQPTKPNFSAMRVKDLKQYIKEHNLQETIKFTCGKPVSKCRKAELIDALS
ncbi:MAG: hypothetical protein WBM62_22930 [Crocosphaera sp.]